MVRFASPKARSLAAELGVDAATLTGTGKDGAITTADVRAAASDTPDFGPAGRALVNAVLAAVPKGWHLDEREREVLHLAARQADHLALLDEVVERDGPMTLGSAGQPTVHPAIQEARQARLAISRMLGQLELPDDDGEAATEATTRARRAAQARWKGRGSRGAA